MALAFLIIIGLSILIAFLTVVVAVIYDMGQDEKAKKQHLMFNQLKKGDFVWKVSIGTRMSRMRSVIY
jgi:Na+-transporting methylmalonyl-CoA/oxaloacetate decarboxylase gamma subunit